jgi:hypothetical protein
MQRASCGNRASTFAHGASSAVDAYLRVRLHIVLPHAKYGPTLGLEASAVFRVATQGLRAQSCQLSSLHSAQATPALITSALAISSSMRDISRGSLPS